MSTDACLPANVYSNGTSEEIIGKAIKKYNIPRDKVVILSKCFSAVGEEPDIRTLALTQQLPYSKDYVNHFGNHKIQIFLYRSFPR